MRLFRDFIKNTFVPTKRAIHDCVDTGGDLSLTTGNEVNFPVDCVNRDYKSTTISLWDNINSIVKDTIDDTELKVKYKLTLNGAVNSICTMKVTVPHPGGDILVDEFDLVLYKNNIDINFTAFSLLYNGTDSEAKTYGFKITMVTSSNMTLKARSILITV